MATQSYSSNSTLEKEQCHPEQFVAPTEEDLQKVEENMRKWLEKRAERVSRIHGPLFEAWKKQRQDQGLPIQIEKGQPKLEEPRLKEIDGYIKALKERFTILKRNDISIADPVKRNASVQERNAMVRKACTQVGSFIIFFKDNEIILLKFEDGLNEVQRGASTRRLEDIGMQAGEKLEEVFPAHDGIKDARHRSDYYTQRAAYHKSQGQACGTQHFNLLTMKGHSQNQVSKDQGLYCQTISGDSRGGKTTNVELKAARAKAASTYTKDTFRIDAAMGFILKVLFPEIFTKMKEHRDEFMQAGMLTKESEYECCTTKGRVCNDPVSSHKDLGDARRILAPGTCHGKFVGGDFCLPDLDIRFKELPGDVVYMHAALITHTVTHFVGQRTSTILTAKTDASCVKKYRNDMSEEEKAAFDKERADKLTTQDAERAAKRLKELQLIKEYIGTTVDISSGDIVVDNPSFPRTEEDYKFAYVHNYWRRLQDAQRAKNKRVRSLKKAGQGEQAAKEAQWPVSLFYVFNKQEQSRLAEDKGLNPFEVRASQRPSSGKKRKRQPLETNDAESFEEVESPEGVETDIQENEELSS